MGQGELQENYGGTENKFQLRGGLPKLFCLMREDLEKNKLVFESFISSDYYYFQRNMIIY